MRDETTNIANILSENFKKIANIEVFAFGSAIGIDSSPNDIDILVVYEDTAIPDKIRSFLEGLGYLPIHLIFLTRQEEIETDFIRKQNCVSIL
jgi:predicted nucleotidyltransferase